EAGGRAGDRSRDGAVPRAHAGVVGERWAGDDLDGHSGVGSGESGVRSAGWWRGKTEVVRFGPWWDFFHFGNWSFSRKATSCLEDDKFPRVASNVQNWELDFYHPRLSLGDFSCSRLLAHICGPAIL